MEGCVSRFIVEAMVRGYTTPLETSGKFHSERSYLARGQQIICTIVSILFSWIALHCLRFPYTASLASLIAAGWTSPAKLPRACIEVAVTCLIIHIIIYYSYFRWFSWIFLANGHARNLYNEKNAPNENFLLYGTLAAVSHKNFKLVAWIYNLRD